jgi:nondiscriminating aspartyl-tRNA synthetase
MGVEVMAEHIEVLSSAQTPPLEIFNPEAVEKNRLETLLDHRAISLPIPEVLDVFRVQAVVLEAFREHLRGQGFTEILSPKLVLAGAEGGSAVFEVKYYDRAAYLAQSPQFYKQIMVGSGLERVFEVGHAYRAEKSETARHMTEFLSLDFEMGLIDSVQDVIVMHTGGIRAMFDAVRERCGKILERRKLTLPEVGEIPQLSFPEARRALAERFSKTEGVEGDLDTEGERLISEWAQKDLGSELIFVTGYHVANRPMYTMADKERPPLTHSFDLLFRGVEITTGSQRIHQYEQLVESIRSRGLSPAHYEGYLEAFRHGMPPHGGMATGIERLLNQMLNLSNVKEVSAFPRDRYRLVP